MSEQSANPTSPTAAGSGEALAKPHAHDADRRGFFTRLAAIAIGGLVTVFPFAAGLFVFADPLRRGGGKRDFLRVTMLDAVPDDGVPRHFPVLAGRVDAWNYFPNEPIGVVFMVRQKGAAEPTVFQSTCPHAGCMLDFVAREKAFKCPCHNSSFQVDGAIIEPSPAPRPMDQLKCELRGRPGAEEVWVQFENFQTGIAAKQVRG